MSSNFSFLDKDFPVLAQLGQTAERYVYSDSNSCLIKLGMIGETITNLMFEYDHVPWPKENTAATRINALAGDGLISQDLTDVLHTLRKVRNRAAHDNYASVEHAKELLRMTHSICEWFMQVYGDYSYQNQEFHLPWPSDTKTKAKPVQEEVLEAKLLAQAQQQAAKAPGVSVEERRERAAKAASQRQKSEMETRLLIDEQLRQVGWEADTINLQYSKGTRPEKGRNLAIAEWPTNSSTGKRGFADYALFVEDKLVGFIEAKAEHKDVSYVIDYQCKDYSRSVREDEHEYLVGTWGEYKVPFTFSTNGRPYLKQLDTKSGIWFLDLRKPDNAPKALQGWISPTGIKDLLEKNLETALKNLEQLDYDLLRDKDGLNLREYQIKAIKAAEQAIAAGQPKVILAMATGTGKTRTILGMIYRFLKTERFRRILFLVDRTALGEQAQDVFKEVKLEDLMTLDAIYNIKNLEEREIDKETRVQVATVQSMVKRILYNESDKMPSVTDYDLIIVDEAHRGYILDKEMAEDELLYRDQRDYVSKYRTVLEYFDAVQVALTATPAKHTTDIFGRPVFNYSYREAVIEGYLVDHDAPHIIETELSRGGIQYKKGETVAIYDPASGELVNSDLLEDELSFDIDDFNKQVITEAFNRTVLTEIARDIDPEEYLQGKTLIYAVDDQHADLIVKILKEIYTGYGVDNDAIMKITGSVGGGNKKKVMEAIKRFKNERNPSIAVTVDLLTTGIDVPEITTLVFMRRVKSRILFEQMLGRATRLCANINKTHFEIYDAVGVYAAIDAMSNMRSVAVDPTTTFTQLLDGLAVADEPDKIQTQIAQILAKVQRKKRNMDKEAMEHFVDLSGGLEPTQFVNKVNGLDTAAAREYLIGRSKLFDLLDKMSGGGGGGPVVISDKEDRLADHTRGYGKGKKPEDYLDNFAKYVQDNINEVAALNIVCTRPRDLTRDTLKALRLELDREGYTTKQLNTAISKLTNQEMTADIISIIRRYAIGSRLISHEARIRQAVDKLRQAHAFSKQETNWINRMEKYLIEESVLNISVFDEDLRFKDQGGFARINKIFENKLESVILELNEYLYDDGGRPA